MQPPPSVPPLRGTELRPSFLPCSFKDSLRLQPVRPESERLRYYHILNRTVNNFSAFFPPWPRLPGGSVSSFLPHFRLPVNYQNSKYFLFFNNFHCFSLIYRIQHRKAKYSFKKRRTVTIKQSDYVISSPYLKGGPRPWKNFLNCRKGGQP